MVDHVCQTCAKKRPDCGHKKQVGPLDGYCRDWLNSSNEMPHPERLETIGYSHAGTMPKSVTQKRMDENGKPTT